MRTFFKFFSYQKEGKIHEFFLKENANNLTFLQLKKHYSQGTNPNLQAEPNQLNVISEENRKYVFILMFTMNSTRIDFN